MYHDFPTAQIGTQEWGDQVDQSVKEQLNAQAAATDILIRSENRPEEQTPAPVPYPEVEIYSMAPAAPVQQVQPSILPLVLIASVIFFASQR